MYTMFMFYIYVWSWFLNWFLMLDIFVWPWLLILIFNAWYFMFGLDSRFGYLGLFFMSDDWFVMLICIVISNSWCLMLNYWCLMFNACCLMLDAWYFKSNIFIVLTLMFLFFFCLEVNCYKLQITNAWHALIAWHFSS